MKPRILFIQNQFSHAEALKYGLPGGVSHYRQRNPGKYLHEYDVTYAGKEFMHLNSIEEMYERVDKIFTGHDIIQTKFLDNQQAILCVLSWCKDHNVPLVVDFDDNILSTDGLAREKFAYPEHSDERHNLELLMRECTAITVSVPALVDVYKPYNPNVFVTPNFTDTEEWKNLRNAKSKRTKIGWIASLSHTPDHDMMVPVYRRILEKHPKVLFSFCGHYYHDMLEGIIPKGNYELKSGIGWWNGHPSGETYPKLLASQGYDIGLAPLIPSQFNASRSLAKWMEYSMLGIPTVVSNYGPYLELKNDEALKCLVEDDWVEALHFLIGHKRERESYGITAKQRVFNSHAESCISGWRSAFATIRTWGFNSPSYRERPSNDARV